MKKVILTKIIFIYLLVFQSCNINKNVLTTKEDNIAIIVPKTWQQVKPKDEDWVREKYHYRKSTTFPDICILKENIFLRIQTFKSSNTQKLVSQHLDLIRYGSGYKYYKSYKGTSNRINYATFIYSYDKDTIVNRKYHTVAIASDNLTFISLNMEFSQQDSTKAMYLHNYIIKHFKRNKNSAALDSAFLIKEREYLKSLKQSK